MFCELEFYKAAVGDITLPAMRRHLLGREEAYLTGRCTSGT